MARPKSPVPTVPLNLSLEADLNVRLKLELFSDLESRIPFGAISKYINDVLRRHFAAQDVLREDEKAFFHIQAMKRELKAGKKRSGQVTPELHEQGQYEGDDDGA